nr:HAD-IIIA family hydrolase [Saprospiraceae bacterium]
MNNPLSLFREINTVVLDCDGVLTNSQLLVTEEGELLRSMSVRDGYAIKKAIAAGIRICVITGGSSRGVELRLKALGVPHYFGGVQKKFGVFKEWVDFHELDVEKILYIGDDMPDFEIMKMVGFPACPSDAAREITDICKYVSPYKGGEGCVRDVLEKILKIQGKWLAV